LTSQLEVDIYNLHLDAGRSAGDRSARAAQITQLAEAIAQHSARRAVIVGGDTNLWGRDIALLDVLNEKEALLDSCRIGRCIDPGRVDRVLFRSSETLQLALKSWRIDKRFVDSNQRALSDHLPVAVEF